MRDFRYDVPKNAQLASQNTGRSWRDCETAGLKHRPGSVVTVNRGPRTVQYVSCARCPVNKLKEN